MIIAAPFIMVLGGYTFSNFFSLAIAYFTLEFIHVVWAICNWFDQKILDLYFSNSAWYNDPFAAMLTQFVSLGSFIIMPIIWIGLMGIVGGSAVQGLQVIPNSIGASGAVRGVGGKLGSAGGKIGGLAGKGLSKLRK